MLRKPKTLKSKIADEVQSEHSEFKNVYVSFNPDVVERLTEYGNQIRAGEPVEGFFEEFTTSINRMFPESKYSPSRFIGFMDKGKVCIMHDPFLINCDEFMTNV